MRVVITGFGPFPGAPFNPSAALARALVRRRRPALARIERTAYVFATSYASVDRDLPTLFARQPDVVLMFGVAGKRRKLCIETRARNAALTLFPDAEQVRPESSAILRGGPPALFGRAPFAKLAAAARIATPAVRVSHDAGRYLCNYAYWRGLERAAGRATRVQFVHIPPVRTKSSRRRPRARNAAPSFFQLVRAGEALLIALVAASRH